MEERTFDNSPRDAYGDAAYAAAFDAFDEAAWAQDQPSRRDRTPELRLAARLAFAEEAREAAKTEHGGASVEVAVSYAPVARADHAVYNLFDFYAVMEAITAYPNDVEGPGTGDGGSASGNQTVEVSGFGFITDVKGLYSIVFRPTDPRDLLANGTARSANVTAPSTTALAFTTPNWGADFGAQLASASVAAEHPRLYKYLELPNPRGVYEVGDLSSGEGLGKPAFYWSRDWLSLEFSNLFGAKGGDVFQFAAAGLSPNNTYRCLFTTGDATLSYRGPMLFSETVVPASSSNLTCVSPPWGLEYEAAPTKLYLIEREAGRERLLFNARGRVPRVDMFEAWDAVIPANASAGARDTISISAYGLGWGGDKYVTTASGRPTGREATHDDSFNYTCVFVGLTNVSAATAPGVVAEAGAGIVPVMEVPGTVLTWRSRTTIHCELGAWGELFPAMATRMELRKGGDVVREVSYAGGDAFTFDPDWAAYTQRSENGARGGDHMDFDAAGLNASAAYLCCFTNPVEGFHEDPANTNPNVTVWLPNDEVACSDANVTGPAHLQCFTPAWGRTYQGKNATVTVVEATAGASVASSGRVVPVRTFTVGLEGRGAAAAATKVPRAYDDRYYFFPALDRVEPASGTARGGQNVTVRAFGLDPTLSDQLACRFTYSFLRPNGRVKVYEGEAAPVRATHTGPGEPFEVRCVTPDWGSANPGYRAEVSLVNLNDASEMNKVRNLDDTKYHFLPDWTGYAVPRLQDQAGAAGGDDIFFQGSGFDRLVPGLYFCHFELTTTAAVFMHSAPATAASSTEVTCVTPQWGRTRTAANVTAVLMEDTTLKADSAAYGGLVPAVDPAAVIHYDFWPSFTRTTPAQGTAQGGNDIVFAAFGLVPQLSGVYRCEFHGIKEREHENSMFVVPRAAKVEVDSVTCEAPPWGNTYPGAEVFVRIVSTLPARTGGYEMVRPVGNSSATYPSRLPLRCASYSEASGYSDYCGLTYNFIADWVAFTSEKKYGAAGGDVLTFSAAGMDAEEYYICRFTDANDPARVLDSAPVAAPSLFRFVCVSPPWGSFYEAAATTVEVLTYVAKDELYKRNGEATDNAFPFFEAWNSLGVFDGPATGGTALPLAVFGLGHGDDRDYYSCLFVGQRNGTVEFVETTTLLPSGPGALTCVTPVWTFAQDYTTVSLLDSTRQVGGRVAIAHRPFKLKRGKAKRRATNFLRPNWSPLAPCAS